MVHGLLFAITTGSVTRGKPLPPPFISSMFCQLVTTAYLSPSNTDLNDSWTSLYYVTHMNYLPLGIMRQLTNNFAAFIQKSRTSSVQVFQLQSTHIIISMM